MAFTVSHMAAALPFYRYQKWISFEALLLGTMLPDLPYFLNSSITVAQQSHHWTGLLTYSLPWGLGVFIVWYWLLKPATIALLRPWLNIQILQSVPCRNIMSWLKFGSTVVLGLLLGASTHLIWDGITHPDGFIARHIVWLQMPVTIGSLDTMPLARLLQYASSLLGLCYIGWFIQQHMQQSATHTVSQIKTPIIVLKKWHSLLIMLLVCFGSLFCGLQAMLKWQDLWVGNPYLFLAKVLVGLLQGAVGLFIGYAVSYQVLYRLYAKYT